MVIVYSEPYCAVYLLATAACGPVDRVLDLRSEGLGFDSHSHTAGHVWKCWANFSFNNASAHPAVLGTWWNEKLENCEWH